jgi:hypothetical protein
MKNQRENWTVGEIVRVGFLSLRIIGNKIATPGNYAADEWPMESLNGKGFYRFIPHRGLYKMGSRAEALSAGATI